MSTQAERIQSWVDEGKELYGDDIENDLKTMVADFGIDLVASGFLSGNQTVDDDYEEDVIQTIEQMIH